MIDYLSSLAQKAVTPSAKVLPFFRPMFEERGPSIFETGSDETSTREEIVEIDSPDSLREVRDIRSFAQTEPLLRDDQNDFSSHEPIARNSISSVDEEPSTNPESTIPRPSFQHHFDLNVPLDRGPEVELSFEGRLNKPTIPVHPARPLRSNTSFDSSFVRQQPSVALNDVAQERKQTAERSIPGDSLKDLQTKAIGAAKQEQFIVTRERILETRANREPLIPQLEARGSTRNKEIIPLSATWPLPVPSTRTLPPNTSAVQPVPETIVHVTIGRVEVRANVGNQKQVVVREQSSSRPSQGLDDYLRGGSSGRST